MTEWRIQSFDTADWQGLKWGKISTAMGLFLFPSPYFSFPFSPLPFPFYPSPPLSHQTARWHGSTVSSPSGVRLHTRMIFWAQKCVWWQQNTITNLRHTCMAVVRKKWRYGFKPAREVPVCRAGPYHPTLSTADWASLRESLGCAAVLESYPGSTCMMWISHCKYTAADNDKNNDYTDRDY